MAYYLLLLKTPGSVTKGLPAKAYQQAIADYSSTLVPNMMVGAQAPKRRRKDDTIDGDDGAAVLDAPRPLPLKDAVADGAPDGSQSEKIQQFIFK